MTKDDKDVVSAVRKVLCDKVGKKRYDLWFGQDTQLTIDNSTFYVGVANQFAMEWLRGNFRKPITEAIQQAYGQAFQIIFQVNQQLQQTAVLKNDDAQSSVVDSGVVEQVAAKKTLATTEAKAQGVVANRLSRRYANFSSFVLGSCNQMAFTSANTVATQLGSYSPLLLYGPSGVGKTHLLESIITATRKKYRQLRSVFLSAEQFTTYFVEAVRGSGLPSFRRKYRGVQLLIIDDIHFFARKKATLVEFQHTLDILSREGRQIVMSSDRAPNELRELGPEVITRISSGMACRVEVPDFDTRLGIVSRIAHRLEATIPPAVQELVAHRLVATARELMGALNRLQVSSQATGKPVSLDMAEEALAEIFQDHSAPIRLKDIEKAVCQVFGLEEDSLQSARKTKSVARPRMLAMYLARKHTPAALAEIGHHFGNRSHSTVISAQKKVDRWVKEHDQMQLDGRPCEIEDAIRRVEENMRVG